MPGFTLPDCLPFFICEDSPCLNTGTECEPSTVFCDLVNLLDTRLTVVDNVVNRTDTAIPIAKVARTAVWTPNVNGTLTDFRVPWDTVIVDNDNMVDLDLNSKVVNVSKPGIYYVTSYLVGAPPQVVSNILNHYIGETTGTFDAEYDTLWREGTTPSNVAVEKQVTQAQINSFSGQYPITTWIGFQGATGNGIFTFNYVEMTVYWVADI